MENALLLNKIAEIIFRAEIEFLSNAKSCQRSAQLGGFCDQFPARRGSGDKFWPPKGACPPSVGSEAPTPPTPAPRSNNGTMPSNALPDCTFKKLWPPIPPRRTQSSKDATTQVRFELRGNAVAKMLDLHNQEYGFARNLAGLRWVMLGFSALGAGGCAAAWALGHGSAWGTLILISK
jgi:hypothetical protein